MNKKISRRSFIKQSAASVTLAGLSSILMTQDILRVYQPILIGLTHPHRSVHPLVAQFIQVNMFNLLVYGTIQSHLGCQACTTM